MATPSRIEKTEFDNLRAVSVRVLLASPTHANRGWIVEKVENLQTKDKLNSVSNAKKKKEMNFQFACKGELCS